MGAADETVHAIFPGNSDTGLAEAGAPQAVNEFLRIWPGHIAADQYFPGYIKRFLTGGAMEDGKPLRRHVFPGLTVLRLCPGEEILVNAGQVVGVPGQRGQFPQPAPAQRQVYGKLRDTVPAPAVLTFMASSSMSQSATSVFQLIRRRTGHFNKKRLIFLSGQFLISLPMIANSQAFGQAER